jgi:sRNA-binding regulator protein Hfq
MFVLLLGLNLLIFRLTKPQNRLKHWILWQYVDLIMIFFNIKIEIEGKKVDLLEEFEFKTKEKKIRIKLFVNNGVSEIDMYKMFSNYIDLIYVDGISKLKKLNLNKTFYNCISLLSIPDINDWEIEECNTY